MKFHHVGHDGLDLLTSWSTHLGLPKSWDYRGESPCPAYFILNHNFWVRCVCLLNMTQLLKLRNWMQHHTDPCVILAFISATSQKSAWQRKCVMERNVAPCNNKTVNSLELIIHTVSNRCRCVHSSKILHVTAERVYGTAASNLLQYFVFCSLFKHNGTMRGDMSDGRGQLKAVRDSSWIDGVLPRGYPTFSQPP